MVMLSRFCYCLQGLFFKLRMFTPCAVTHLNFDIDIPDDDEIQASLISILYQYFIYLICNVMFLSNITHLAYVCKNLSESVPVNFTLYTLNVV